MKNIGLQAVNLIFGEAHKSSEASGVVLNLVIPRSAPPNVVANASLATINFSSGTQSLVEASVVLYKDQH